MENEIYLHPVHDNYDTVIMKQITFDELSTQECYAKLYADLRQVAKQFIIDESVFQEGCIVCVNRATIDRLSSGLKAYFDSLTK
jgi:hypothetical protein